MEKFSFCLHTLLSDIAVQCPEYQEEIINMQVECLVFLTNSIKQLQENNQNSSSSKLYLCKSTVPLVLGLARAIGRFSSSKPPLICRLFPKPKPPSGINQMSTIPVTEKKVFGQFRSIIPRSLSGLTNALSKIDIMAVTKVIKVLVFFYFR